MEICVVEGLGFDAKLTIVSVDRFSSLYEAATILTKLSHPHV